jgi:tetratricopeptide (TPR) repeat protein
MRDPQLTLCLLAVALVLGVSGCSRQDQSRTVNPADLKACDTSPDEQAGILACKRAIDAGVIESGMAVPETEQFYWRLGIALEGYGEYDDAIRVWREAVRRFPARADFHYRLGRLLVETFSAHEEAYGPLSEAIRRGSAEPKARTLLKEVLEQMGRIEEARALGAK